MSHAVREQFGSVMHQWQDEWISHAVREQFGLDCISLRTDRLSHASVAGQMDYTFFYKHALYKHA